MPDSALVALPKWKNARWPISHNINGHYCQLEPYDKSRHLNELYSALCLKNQSSSWDYLPYGPFTNLEEFSTCLQNLGSNMDSFFFALISKDNQLSEGLISFSRILVEHGVIEIAHVHFSDRLKRTTPTTEAIYLLLREAFDNLGYRRCEWKCHAQNDRSRQAALRLGFAYEGRFRQDRVVKGHNRDTDWFSIIDKEWPARKERLEQWLDPSNFDKHGQQKARLGK